MNNEENNQSRVEPLDAGSARPGSTAEQQSGDTLAAELKNARERIQAALAYANTIVVESDGWPMAHTAADIRSLLIMAFSAGQDYRAHGK